MSSRTPVFTLGMALVLAGAAAAQPASAVPVGFGCAPTAVIPDLSLTPPVLGGTATLSVVHSFNPSPIIVFASAGPPVVTTLGTPFGPSLPCQLFVDPFTAFPFVILGGIAIPAATTTLTIPANPALAGAAFTLQAVILPATNPIGPLPVLTNGVHATLGF